MFFLFQVTEISATPECRYSRVVIIIGACQLEQSWNVFGSGAQTRIRKNKHICVVTCPTPLIVFNWSTIRLRSGPPLENIVWIITVYRASNHHHHPHPAFLWHMLSAVAAAWHQVHTISPICPSSHALLYFLPSHSVRPSRGANLLPTWLLHRVGSAGNKKTTKQNKTNPIRSWKRLRRSDVPCNLHGLADACL